MKTIEDVKSYCLFSMSQDLPFLEQVRRRVYMKFAATAAVAACAEMAFLFLLQKRLHVTGTEAAVIAIAAVIAAAIVITAALSKFLAKEYRSVFKLFVMNKLVKFLDPNLQYEPDGYVAGGLYGLAKLFRRQADRFYGQNYVKGRLGDTNVEFSEVISEYSQRRKGRDHYYPIFRGFLFVAEAKKCFAGHTLVLPDVAENLLGKLGQTLQSLAPPVGRLVKFDDTEFEKRFVVYSENEAEARAILTPKLMNRIVEFKKKRRCDLRLAFTGSHIFAAISFNHSPCQAPLFGSILNFSKLERYLENIDFAAGIADEVNRNPRICSPDQVYVPAKQS